MPTVGGGPFDSVEYIMNLARARANDMQAGSAGNLLSDNQAYTLPFFNAAYRQVQRELTNRGVETLVKDNYQATLIPVQVQDPGIEIQLSYTGFFNGTSQFLTPTLPPDMVGPLRLWERPTGSYTDFVPMAQSLDGLPSYRQFIYLRWWEWRSNMIVMRGATQSNDIRIRYNAWFPDVQAGADFSTTYIPIVNVAPALAWYVVAEFAWPRGSEKPAEARAQGLQEIQAMCALSNRMKQRTNNRRIPYSRGDHSGWGWY